MPTTKRVLVITLLAGWLVITMKLFLPALLLYFLVLRPLVGAGYGLNYTFFYVAIFCPTATVLLFQKVERKKQERSNMIEKGRGRI